MKKRNIILAFYSLLALSVSAQKITLGSCKMKDGGEYKGQMMSGKPHGKGTTYGKTETALRASMPRGNVRAMACIPSMMAKSMKDSGCRITNTAKVLSISITTTSM